MAFVVLVLLAGIVPFVFLGLEGLHVALPVLVGVVFFAGFFGVRWARSGVLPISELGVFYAFVVLVYLTMPAIGFLAKGMHYGPGSDYRLQVMQPTSQEVASLTWQALLYLVCFVLAYTTIRGPATPKYMATELQKKPSAGFLVFTLVSLGLYFFILGMSLTVRTGTLSGEGYSPVSRLPLSLQQVSNHLGGMFIFANIALLSLLFTNYRRYRVLIFAVAAYHTWATLSAMTDRSDLVQYLIVVGLLYHRFVKSLRLRTIMLAAALGMVGILAFGIVRSTVPYGEDVELKKNLVTKSNEFESLFGTAYELNMARRNGSLVIPAKLYFADVFALFPQQLVPFKKIRQATWYLEEYHPSVLTSGGGYSFGALSEAAIGFGLPELIIRALLIGCLFGWVYRWYLQASHNFWVTVIYLWLCVECYQCFRSSSFIIFTCFVYRVVPFYLIARWLGYQRFRVLGRSL